MQFDDTRIVSGSYDKTIKVHKFPMFLHNGMQNELIRDVFDI